MHVWVKQVRRVAVVAWLAGSSVVGAQTGSSAAPVVVNRERDTGTFALPLPRILGEPPSVDSVVRLVGQSPQGIANHLASLAMQDLRLYDMQLDGVFTPNSAHYPEDSLRRVRVERASAWVTRLRSIPAATQHLQCVPFADVAMHAEQDSLAKRLIDGCLADTHLAANERSRVLASAVVLFSNEAQDTVRLARNLGIAERYAAQLDAMPETGFRTKHDSVNVVYRKQQVRVRLFQTVVGLRHDDLIVAALPPFLAMARRLPAEDRWDLVRSTFPYYLVATALSRSPGGRVRLDSLNVELLRLVVPRANEWPATVPPERRAAEGERRQQYIRNDVMDMFAFVGKPAPPLLANAWINTSDSSYTVTPRSHPFNDGIVRVIAFASSPTNDFWPLLRRLQSHFPRDGTGAVQVMYATPTSGAIGADLATPAEEVAWLQDFAKREKVSFSVVVWAGQKSVVNEYQWNQPAPSTMMNDYHAGMLPGGCCVLVDGQGVVRGYQWADSRREEAWLVEAIDRLRRESVAVRQ